MSLLTVTERISLANALQNGSVAPAAVSVAPPADDTTDLIVRRPVTVDLIAYAGDDLNFELAVYSPVDGSPLDLTSGEICCQARTTRPDWMVLGKLETLIYDTNVIAVVLRSWLTAKLPAQAVWDCELLLQGVTTTLAGGSISTFTDVSRCRQPR